MHFLNITTIVLFSFFLEKIYNLFRFFIWFLMEIRFFSRFFAFSYYFFRFPIDFLFFPLHRFHFPKEKILIFPLFSLIKTSPHLL